MLQDAAARQQAIDPASSYAVSAPAGSGKTELLIQRTLSLLASVDQPENILAITFTRKAANEMRERVVKALLQAQRAEPVYSEHEQATRTLANAALRRNAERGWNLLANSSRLRFQTIDGLCRQLANQLCLETGIVVPPSMSEDSGNLYLKAAEKTLEFMDDPGPVGEALRLLISHVDGHLEKLVELIADLLSSRDSWLPIIIPGDIDQNYLNERVDALIEETLFEAAGTLAPYSSDIESLLDYALRHQQGAKQLHPETPGFVPEPEPSELPKWKALRSFLLTSSGTYRSRVTVANGFPTESEHASKEEAKARKATFVDLVAALQEDEQVLSQLNRIAVLPDPHIEDENFGHSEAINQALFSLLPVAAACFNTLSQETGETDFTAVAIAAIEALGQPDQPTPLALRLDYRIQHILVDEFQDTSRVQIDLLERLTAGWQPDDGRSLFIVGDGMQSIYGFRKANVSLFIRARRQGIGDIEMTPLDLTANFRSDKQIVDWVNQSFSTFFPQQDNLVQGQVAFKQAEAIRPDSDWTIELKGFASAELEAEAIASDIVNKTREAGPESSSDQASEQIDLAILVRGRPHLEAILPALRRHNISWQAQDIDPLANRMAVMDIHCLTRALCVPADRIAWLAIMRAPWAGLDMADLLYLCEWQPEEDAHADDFLPLWSALSAIEDNPRLSPQGKLIAHRLQQQMQYALQTLGKQPLRQVVKNLWRALGADTALLEERDHQDIEDYLDLLEQHEVGGAILDWGKFQRRLEELYSRPLSPSANRPATSAAADVKVQIMTIHKSKGLEFDHVYLPALGRASATNNDPLLLWWQREYEDGSEAYLIAAKPSSRDKRVGDKERQTLYDYLKAEENQRQRQETARLLYVACTRARKSLFLSATLGWDDKKEQIRKPSSNSMLAILWDLYEAAFSENYVPVFSEEDESVRVLSSIRRLPADRSCALAKNAEPGEPLSKLHQRSQNSNYSDNYIARISGELIHQSLMRIVREHISRPETGHFLADWTSGTTGLGLNQEQQEAVLNRLQQMLDAILSDETGRWLLDTRHEQSAAELEIDYLDSKDSVQLAIVDRTFVEDGTRWVIDYKSSSPAEGEALEHFIARETEAYKPQLGLYMSLFAEQQKRAMLYFPAISASAEVQL